MCNCSAENVYPSPFQMSARIGRLAYKNQLGLQSKKDDIIDIFNYGREIKCVSIEEQEIFCQKLLDSILKR